MFRTLFSLLVAALLSACAQQTRDIASASVAEAPPREKPTWAFEKSDIPVDPGFRFGQLENGMRFVIRQNATPPDTAIVRLEISAGSIDEEETELGYAHFVEHMAFNGSTRVPEGEMVRLLERNGLKFGADTNAATGFDRTTYKLDLPRNDPQLLEVALMLMRETASELTISQGAVDRERGVILAELRDRNTFQLRNTRDELQFFHPDALYPERLPIGTVEALSAASAASLRTFWEREYVPAHSTLVVIGAFDPDLVEAQIRQQFASWAVQPASPQPGGGPVDAGDGGRTAIYIDPALPERIVVTRHGPWKHEPDTIAQRQENLLRAIGYSIVNRRFQRLSRQEDPPFRGAGFGTGDVFEAGRSTRLIVDTPDRKWRRGLESVALEYRRALEFGFTKAEVDEQVANIRTQTENAAAASDTRSNHALADAVWSLVRNEQVPSNPISVLERFNAFAPSIAPAAVLAALKREAVTLAKPLIRFRGRFSPEGGARAIRNAWNRAMRKDLDTDVAVIEKAFAYADFGEPGTVVSDAIEPALGIRTIRYANGVMLNIKRTELAADKVHVRLSIDGGKRLDTSANPLATEMLPYLATGGLGEHSEDDLQTIFAGKTVYARFGSRDDSFVATSRTTPRDLDEQLALLAAFVTDPGYRREGEIQYRHAINRYFAQIDATPNSALRGKIGGILSDGDSRFTLQEPADYRALTFQKLGEDIGERLEKGAIEIGIVGDIDEARAIALVAATFGAIAPREPGFAGSDALPPRTFTADRSQRIVRHTGMADQALLRLTWPTRDDSDPDATVALELLERVLRIELTETLREALGQAYSPSASNAPSRFWKGYGVFGIAASVDVARVPDARAAILSSIRRIRESGPGDDLLQRARQPMIEEHQNALKSNGGWLVLVDRAQTEADRIERYTTARVRIEALGASDVQAMAKRYLDPEQGLEILVLPEGVEPPEGQ